MPLGDGESENLISSRLHFLLEKLKMGDTMPIIMIWGIFFALLWLLVGFLAFRYMLNAKDKA
jgi:hypothetical protein